ncbi:Gldg family protein [Lachnospiraceae bacterium LCP25S3_G4]
MQKLKDLFKSINSKKGTYSVGVTVIVIGIAIVANLLVGQLPESVKEIDISNNNIYEITDTSKKIVSKLEDKVTIHIIADEQTVDDRITRFVDKYAAMSKKITVEWIDPVLHPSALTTYNTEANSIVVSCDKTAKMVSIPFSDIIVADEYSYYTTGTATEKEFDAEGQLTGAINYVTSEVQKKIYRTSGHGESTFSTAVTDLMDKSNLVVSELNLLMDSKIPEDCDLLMMYAPTSDITADEKAAISEYLKKGGKLFLILGDTKKDTSNLKELMQEYGLHQEDGYIADMQRCYQGNYYYLIPNISVTGDMADGITSDMVLVVNSLGLTSVDPARETISVENFMTTSEKSYVVTEAGEKQGTYILGAVATEDVDKAQSRFTVVAGSTMIDSGVTDSFSTLENLPLFMNAITSNFDDMENISVEPKSLEMTYNSVSHPGLFSLLIIIGIPLIVLVSGSVVWWKRRKA